jgi:hypothetical protein
LLLHYDSSFAVHAVKALCIAKLNSCGGSDGTQYQDNQARNPCCLDLLPHDEPREAPEAHRQCYDINNQRPLVPLPAFAEATKGAFANTFLRNRYKRHPFPNRPHKKREIPSSEPHLLN